ncbi:MAG: glycosyl transferase [Acidobacteria bacterium]|nr:glycosyl transferase [Acidobacteriota bacterium]
MADFYQTGVLSTLHRLRAFDQQRIENELVRFSRNNKIALVLPVLYSELEGPALGPILDRLTEVPYINEIVIALDRASAEQFEYAKQYFSRLPQDHYVLWINGPRFRDLKQIIEGNGLPLGPGGKGLSCWLAYGFVLARRQSQIIALHDCDILTYSRELLARLCYPTTNPNLDYEFCKGFYSRVSNKMNGRVTRLLFTPLVRALQAIAGKHPLLIYFDSFRYPLAGEFSMRTDLARVNRIPSDWGLEVGVLAEIYRNCALKRVAQSELCENYDHKHQELSAGDPNQGLVKMSIDITSTMFRTMASEGIQLSSGLFKTLLAKYVKTAENCVARYYADAKINGLEYDRHEEETAVDAFTEAIRIAARRFIEDPLGAPLIPNWNRVVSAFPTFFELLVESVQEDNQKSALAVR